MNYYQILNINREASTKEIKNHYYSLAKKYHPDKHNGDINKCEKFKLLSEAYTTLSNPKKRFIYDLKLYIDINFNFDLNDDDYELLHSYYNKIMNWTEIKFLRLLFLSLPEEFRYIIKKKIKNFFVIKKDSLVTIKNIKFIDCINLNNDYFINLFLNFNDIYNRKIRRLLINTTFDTYDIFVTNYNYSLNFKNNNCNLRINIIGKTDLFLVQNYKLIYEKKINLYEYYYGNSYKLMLNNKEIIYQNTKSENVVIKNLGLYNPYLKRRDDLIIKFKLNLEMNDLVENKEQIKRIFNV